MLNKVRNWLRHWLFKNEELEYEARLQAVRHMRENADIVALARAQLSGFDARSLTLDQVRNRQTASVTDGMDEEEYDAFLNNINALATNPALRVIEDHLTRQQVLSGAMDADSINTLNFNRAAINGIQLFRETIEEQHALYLKRNEAEEDYDPHAAL